MPPLLQIGGLSKRFGAVVVADAISLDVPAGQALGIIGPNGAGKTTLFAMIAGVVLDYRRLSEQLQRLEVRRVPGETP